MTPARDNASGPARPPLPPCRLPRRVLHFSMHRLILHLCQVASLRRCPARGRNVPHPLPRLPIALPPPIPCSANCANVNVQKQSLHARRTKAAPSNRTGAVAQATSSPAALLPRRLLSARRRLAALPSCATAWTADLTGAADPRPPLIGTGIEPSDTGSRPLSRTGTFGHLHIKAWPKQPPQPPTVRHDRQQANATLNDPLHLRSRRQGYHTAWATKRQEAAAAANSPNRVKAAAELLPHEKPQLYAVDVEQSEDLAHEFAAAEPSTPTSLAVELAHLSLASGIAEGALQVQAISTFEVPDAYQCIFVPLQKQQTPVFGATGGQRVRLL